MKNWKLVVPIAALILGGAAACERHDDTTAREYSRNDTRQADTRAADMKADQERTTAPAPGTAMREDAPADAARPGAAAGQGQLGTATGDRRVVTGKMDVQDEDARTFILEGTTQTYVAPQQADLSELDGEEVTVMIDPNGRVTTVEIVADREG